MVGYRRCVAVVVVLASWLATVGVGEAVTIPWNPNSATTVGLEWFPTVQGDAPLPAAVTFPSGATETIDTLTVPLGVTGDSLTAIAEVYEAGDEVPGAVSTQIYRPTDDLQIGGNDSEQDSWATEALGITNLWQSINEATVDDTDFIGYIGPQSLDGRYRFNVGSGAWAAGRRVTGGFVRIRANRIDATGRLRVSYFDGTTAHTLSTITVDERKRNYDVRFPEINPGTGYPWTQAQIVALSTTSAIQIRPLNLNRNKTIHVYQAYLSLNYVTEDRVAVGIAEVDVQDAGTDAAFMLRDPNTGADNWSKASGTDYTILLRRTEGYGQAAWRFLTETQQVSTALLRPDSNAELPVQSYVPLLDSAGRVSVMGTQVPGRGQVFYQTRTDTAVSVDGQPYEYLVPNLGTGGDFQVQKLTPTTSGDYTIVRALVSDLGSGAALNADTEATVTVHRLSTGAQMGGDATVRLADLQATPQLGETWEGTLGSDVFTPTPIYLLEAELSSAATLVGGTAYYLQIHDPDGVIRLVSARYADDDSAAVGVATFGGTADAIATGAFGAMTAHVAADASAMLSTQPDAPTGFGAETVEAATEEHGLEGTGCTVPLTEVAYLDWTPTALGADFGEYQIERGEPAGFYAPFPSMTPGDVVGQDALSGQTSRANHIPVIGGIILDGASADISGGGLLVGPTFGAWYTWWDTGFVPAEYGAAFLVAAGTTFNASAAFIVSGEYDDTDPVDIALNSVHVTTTIYGYQISFFEGALGPASLTHVYDTPLADDGTTVYQFYVSIDGNTVTVLDPEGHSESVTDARAGRLWGPTVLLEHVQPTATIATDALFQFVAAIATDADDEEFVQIYYGEDEAADQVTDWEAAFGQRFAYRIRVVRNGDWVPSAWSANQPEVTLAPQASETVFASNWLQAAAAVNREPSYDWPQPNNDQVLQLAGRDYQQVFQEAENRGDGGAGGFSFEVVGYVGGGNSPNLPTPPGRGLWDGLRDFLRTYTPYLSIRDWTGDVWYGRATLDPAGMEYGEDGSAVALGEVTVIETQAEPTPVAIPPPGS